MKEIKITPPEGYEIDKENSTFECIKFKSIKKQLTYEDIAEKLFKGNSYWYTNAYGQTIQMDCRKTFHNDCVNNPNNFTSEKQSEKLMAINKLMNVAKYLNGDWKPDWKNAEIKYYIRDNVETGLHTHYSYHFNSELVYFKTGELAMKAIEILGEDTIRLALSTDW